jgi:NAD(P)-dependent dehydrogenase (short-subunit alcohol dehydrogenase family)
MQTALITGANSGIGLATAKALALEKFELILLVRSKEKADATLSEILKVAPNTKVDFFFADLIDLVSVKKAAEEIKAKYEKIDRLINNAGYSPVGIYFTKDGYEKSFVANHLGHFVLTLNLIDLLKKSPESRVISVSSAAHALGKVERLFQKNNTKLSDMGAYGDGKLANILFTKGLAKYYKDTSITAYSLHPGVVKSNFGSDMSGLLKVGFALARPFMISVEKGAATSIYLATTDIQDLRFRNGYYFAKSKPASTLNNGITPESIEWFWEKSLEAVKEI